MPAKGFVVRADAAVSDEDSGIQMMIAQPFHSDYPPAPRVAEFAEPEAITYARRRRGDAGMVRFRSHVPLVKPSRRRKECKWPGHGSAG